MTEVSPLLSEIKKLIKSAGPMPVWRYMELCLMHPQHGYYVSRDPLGREKDFSLERGLIAGGMFFVAGFVVDLVILIEWINRSMGPLDAVRPALFAMTFMTLGMQLLFASFFLSIFRIKVRAVVPASSNADTGSR